MEKKIGFHSAAHSLSKPFRVFASPLQLRCAGSTENFDQILTALKITFFTITAIHICPFFVFGQYQNPRVRVTTIRVGDITLSRQAFQKALHSETLSTTFQF
jgi:hypothetical protein